MKEKWWEMGVVEDEDRGVVLMDEAMILRWRVVILKMIHAKPFFFSSFPVVHYHMFKA